MKRKSYGLVSLVLILSLLIILPKQLLARNDFNGEGLKPIHNYSHLPIAPNVEGIPTAEDSLLYIVNSLGDGALVGPPTSCDDGTGNCTFRAAIQAANSHSGEDTIVFSISGIINLTQVLPDLNTNISVIGPGYGQLTIRRDTGGDYRILNVVTPARVSLSGITVRNGSMLGGTNGGGIANSGTLFITDCIILENRSTAEGGGLFNAVGGTVTISGSLIWGNFTSGFHGPVVSLLTGRGGGLANRGTMRVTNSTIYANSAYGQEFGVFVGGGEGGGIQNSSGASLTVTSSTISVNNCLSPPGSLNGFGGGISTQTGVAIKSTIIARNIVLNTSYRDVQGTFLSHGFNLIGEADGSGGFTMPTDQKGSVAATLDPRIQSGPQYTGGPTPTVTLFPDSPAIDKGTSAGILENLSTDQRGTGFPRTYDNPSISNATGGDGTDVGALEALPNRMPRADFDGDLKTDISVFRAGTWYLQRSAAGFQGIGFGIGTDSIVPGDYDGDAKTDIAVFRTDSWYILKSSDLTVLSIPWGSSGDIPKAEDYDGDGKTDLAVYRPSVNTFFVRRSLDAGTMSQYWGIAGDVPFAADFDGDFRADYGVFRDGIWHILGSRAGYFFTPFGIAGDRPLPADYDGDRRADAAVFRNGTWYLQIGPSGSSEIAWGINSDIPVPGDYDGDGKNDVAIFRASTGTWHILASSTGYVSMQFGMNGDVAVPQGYVP